ncbi:queuosine precursor transporter [Methanosphaera sp.]|uniref:queuosine precursor transporter n=1 Tax=Methanosphaera sp. TaxID=2666342 RepID=UPI0025F4A15E|nr:queuosine precursor transporter [Methanosphaera sp.]
MDFNFDYTEKRVIMSIFFCVAFIIANLTTVKIMEIPYIHMEAPAGVLIYPLVYVLTNVLAEVYGERIAQRTIMLGLIADILFVFMTVLQIYLPSPAYYPGDPHLAFVFTQTPRILIFAYISYLIGNLVNARLTTIVNRGTTYLKAKNWLVVAFSELIDDTIMVTGCYLGLVPPIDMVIIIFSTFIISVIWITVAQPFIAKLVAWAQEDAPVTTAA